MEVVSNKAYDEAVKYIQDNDNNTQFSQSLKYHLDQMRFQDKKLLLNRELADNAFNARLDKFLEKQKKDLEKFKQSWQYKADIKNNKILGDYATKQEYSRRQIIHLAEILRDSKTKN